MKIMEIIGIIIFSQWIVACNQEKVTPNANHLGYDFFPLQVGSYNIYQVENTEYKVTGEVVNAAFQLRVEVVDSFRNGSGTSSYILHYLQRASEADTWEFTKAWTARRNHYQAILTEENIPFLKISFPVKNKKTWDGNALNTFGQDDYQMDSLYGTYITPGQDTISNTLTVIQEDNQDYISELDRRYEIYALHTGLVYKEDINLFYCTDTECLGQQIVESGHEYRQYLVESGNGIGSREWGIGNR